jgi:hypothetical protein
VPSTFSFSQFSLISFSTSVIFIYSFLSYTRPVAASFISDDGDNSLALNGYSDMQIQKLGHWKGKMIKE